LDVTGASTLSSTLYVSGDATFATDVSMNADVDISGDLVIRGKLSVYQTRDTMTINTTINDYTLIITEDISLNGELKVSGDASFNSEVFVSGDASFNSDVRVGGYLEQF